MAKGSGADLVASGWPNRSSTGRDIVRDDDLWCPRQESNPQPDG